MAKEDWFALTRRTCEYYDHNADRFWEATRDHDVTQNYQAFLSALPDRKLRLLDFGCGPGRDLKYFRELGHQPVGLDGSREFCEMARAYSGCPCLHRDFLTLDLDPESFDGIFANASLFHVPRAALPSVLRKLRVALRPSGVFFSSNPRGNGEDCQGPRYGNFMEMEAYGPLVEEAGFEVLQHYYRPQGLPREQQPWLAVVSRGLDGCRS